MLPSSRKLGLYQLDYYCDDLKALMELHQPYTLQLIRRESDRAPYMRNPFPVSDVVEYPASGAAAAALGATCVMPD